MPDYKVNIYFSGLILFVRDKATGRYTKAVLFDARKERRVPIEEHFPRLWWRSGGCRTASWNGRPIGREYLDLVWTDGPPTTTGATPFGNETVGALPTKHNARYFAWTSRMKTVTGAACTVDKACLKKKKTSVRVVAILELPKGTLSTCRLASIEHDDQRVVPALSYRAKGQPQGFARAAGEVSKLEVVVPAGADNGITVVSNSFDRNTSEHRSIPAPGGNRCIDLFLANMPRLRCSGDIPGRRPGFQAKHYGMFYKLLSPGVPPKFTRLPHIPRYIKLGKNAVELDALELDCDFQAPEEHHCKDLSANNRPICPMGGGNG